MSFINSLSPSCCEIDPITGHWPHWVKVDPKNNADHWFYEAYLNSGGQNLVDATYEAIGPHFQSNSYGLEKDVLERHGTRFAEVDRSYDGLRKYLEERCIEGLVFWKDGEPCCKIKRRDFGLPWNKDKDGYKVKAAEAK